MDAYKEIIKEIAELIPSGSVSIEVYADQSTTTKSLLEQAETMYTWIPNAHIKFPSTRSGLEASEAFVNAGGRVNMTLVFNQRQAQAVHLATENLQNSGDVFISPFIGRLDDLNLNGLDAVTNIQKYYSQIGSKVQVLAASIRHKDHIKACIDGRVDILTLPLTAISEWVQAPTDFEYTPNPSLEHIPYLELEAETDWHKVDIYHQLTDKGLDKFASDWNGLLKT
jgi:transaldolase